MRLARAYDESDETSAVFRRVLTPAAKFWICKRAPAVTLEAMEVLGGSGYIEESIMPRLYREAPVNSIWEGSGNVMCLDVLRAIERTPKAAEVLRAELADAGDARLKTFAERLQQRLRAADRNDELQARVLVRDLVLALQAALLIKHSPAAVADAFCASRLTGEGGGAFGTLPRGLDLRSRAGCAIDAALRRTRNPMHPIVSDSGFPASRAGMTIKASRIPPAPAPPAPRSRPRRRACATRECRAHRR